MIAMDSTTRWKSALGATLGVSALAFTFGCNAAPQGATLQQSASQPGTPVVVSCEPHQRTLVRPAVVNGATVSQIECVAASPSVAAPQPVAYAQRAPVNYAPAPVRRVSQPVDSELGDARIVPVSDRAVRPVRTNQVVYDERPVRKTRSVAKSAVIIGSSAGAGAGVGAAVGGKKGALIGAAIGGGGAAIWDQVTRRRD
jgi:hypothetical protein